MRTFELVLVGLLATGAVWSLASGNQRKAILSVLFGLDLIVLLWHLAAEGAHWQMAPAYVGVLAFAGLLVLKPSPRTTTLLASAMIVLALLTACLSAILPMFRLPRPTGSFAIGTRVIYLLDQNRIEDAGKGGKRELMIQIWYPAEISRQPYAAYRRRQETTLLSSYQSLLPTHSKWNAPVLKEGHAFPVLLFNPAWNGRRTQNTYLVEDLASHGFVVVGIDHTYNSEPVAFPDGRVAHAIPEKKMEFPSNSLETIEATAGKELMKQTADDIFVLDQMQRLNGDKKSNFYGRLNTENVGALGHSFGGAVAAQVCYSDPRVRAALDLDGSLFGEVQRQGLAKPFMFITEEAPISTPEEASRLSHLQQINNALNLSDRDMFQKSAGYRIVLRGSTHFSFTDKSLFSPLESISTAGSIPPRRQIFIVRAYALAFFEKALLGRSSSLLEPGNNSFPEANFQATAAALR